MKLANDAWTVTGRSGSPPPAGVPYEKATWACTLKLENDGELRVAAVSKKKLILTLSNAGDSAALGTLVDEAIERSRLRETGEPVWWKSSFQSSELGLGQLVFGGVQGIRIASEQLLRESWWRIGNWALLEFTPDPTFAENPDHFATRTLGVHALLRTPGPTHSELTEYQATAAGGFIRCFCAFASGVTFEGFGVFPADEDDVAKADAVLLESPAELSAAIGDPRRIQALWPVLGGWFDDSDVGARLLNSLGAWESAIEQRNARAAVALLITSIEALATPNAPWRTERATERFVHFTGELCDKPLGVVMNHANFAEAFGRKTSRRSVLQHIYDLRSRPFHEGFAPAGTPWVPSLHDRPGPIQVALLSELAREAIIAFGQAPRSDLVGRWPPRQL
jgi:hypothetical protein